MRQIDEVEGKGGAWTGANIKRDAGALWGNKAVRIFVALVIIGSIAKHFFPGVVS